MLNQSSSSLDSRDATPGNCNEILEPPFKKVNISGSDDANFFNSTLSNETRAADPSIAPLDKRIDKLLLLLNANNLAELETEIKGLRADAEARKYVNSDHIVSISRELQPSKSDLKKELKEAAQQIEFLEKHNAILQLGFQKNEKVTTLTKWFFYLEKYTEFNSPEKLYKAYLDASIQAAAVQNYGKDYTEQIECHFEIIIDELESFYSQALGLVSTDNDKSTLGKTLGFSQEVLREVRRTILQACTKLAKETSELQQDISPLVTEEHEIIENAKDMAMWKAKAENLDETLRLRLMNFTLAPSFRILELKVNPVSTYMQAKLKYLKHLELENVRLLELMKASPTLEGLIPAESLRRAEAQIKQLQSINEEVKKIGNRKDSIFRHRIKQFRCNVRNVLGYEIEFSNADVELKITPVGAPFYVILKFSDIVKKDFGKLYVKGEKPEYFSSLINLWIVKAGSIVGFFGALTMNLLQNRVEESFNTPNNPSS